MKHKGKNNKLKQILTAVLVLLLISCTETKKLKLTRLGIGSDEPVYTTYAAALENSDYLNDQGYEFVYDRQGKSVRFASSSGGNVGFGFLADGIFISKPEQMVKPPTINSTFPDMVSFTFTPAEGIICDGLFVVTSSSTVVLDLELRNSSEEEKRFGIVPYMESSGRIFTDIHGDESAFIFNSEKYPDSWTISHELPYRDSLVNIFRVSPGISGKSACNSSAGVPFSLPYSINLTKNREDLILSGRVYGSGNERLALSDRELRLFAFNGDRSELITETCPLSGTSGNPVTDGYFRLNAGNFTEYPRIGQLSVRCYVPGHNCSGGYDTIFPVGQMPASFRRNISAVFRAPDNVIKNVAVNKEDKGNTIQWEAETGKYLFDVYRREESEKSFKKVAASVRENRYTDPGQPGGRLVRYIVIPCEIHSSECLTPSPEVSTVQPLSLEGFLSGENPGVSEAPLASLLCFKKDIILHPGESQKIRMVRATVEKGIGKDKLSETSSELMKLDLSPFLSGNLDRFSAMKKMLTGDRNTDLLILSSFNMMRQVMYPPQGKSSFNYYVFSREPVWGWGHGGQVFHESITMLAYGLLFPESAMNSQRVYSERQYENGYINYRTGSYLDEIIEHNGELTSSAPWYSWLNWEIYKMTSDRQFLQEMYHSGKKFYEFYVSSRDKDGDGLCEWGGHAILESVRDALVAVWDQVGWPSEFESVDLNSMLVMEARSLEKMATELGYPEEAEQWRADYLRRSDLINKYCWDPVHGFYYNVDKKDNDFTFKDTDDLKRQEIIGFLPLWAGIASEQQAGELVKVLTDPGKFWRKNGIPSLSADDPYYNAKGYWNGPVWVEWNYLVVRGLIDYGYHDLARELVVNVARVMAEKLADDHNLWEFYSPDDSWGGYHKTYIWAGIITRMLLDAGIIKN